jgi:hypothetical protein
VKKYILLGMIFGRVASAQTFNEANVFEDKDKGYPDFACDVDVGPNTEIKSYEDLVNLSKGQRGQENLDRVYARLSGGTMPEGFYAGKIIFAASESGELLKALMKSFPVPQKWKDDPATGLKQFGEMLWKGKRFKADPYRHDSPTVQSRILANKMPVTDVNRAIAMMAGERVDKKLAKKLAEEATAQATNEWRFPAKVYCGQSLLDSRRESVIIDYAASADFDQNYDPDSEAATKFQYADKIDFLAGPTGLQIRDEIRMVRPGLYLGRAYMGRVFILNFVLECADGACTQPGFSTAEACDVGGQRINQLAASENSSGQVSLDPEWKFHHDRWIKNLSCISHDQFSALASRQ